MTKRRCASLYVRLSVFSYEVIGLQLRLRGEVHRLVAARDQKYQSNFVEVGRHYYSIRQSFRYFHFQFKNHKIVYRRYAGLFFCICVDANDNELAYLEAIHLFVEILGAQRPILTQTPKIPDAT